ncbi:MAG TPA: LysR family transcriptional regulator [Ramlibacter sp.]|nr:LysR family transcriptional regulator [Ramlibacter sp.]
MDLDLRTVPWARRLKLRHLETFLVLESAGSITAAAERMHMTQPAVSHWLADIEEVIGSSLFVRGRRLELTPAGEILRRHAQRMLGDVQRVDDELKAVRSGLFGRLKVGCIHSAALTLVPDAITALQEKHPKVVVRVEEGTMVDLLDRLGQREFDLVVGTIDVRAHQYGFLTEVLMEDVVRIVCRPGHPLARKRKPTWQEAAGYPWVLPPAESLSRVRVEEAFARQRVALPLPCVETASVAAIQTHLRGTNGLAPLTGLVADFYTSLKLLARVPLAPVSPFAELGMIWADTTPNVLLAELVASLRKNARTKA